jgi:hypothetical protein
VTDKSITVIPNMKVWMLQNVYEIMCESPIKYGLSQPWKGLHTVHNRLCKKLMDIQNCAANGFAEMQRGRQLVHRADCNAVLDYVFGYLRSGKGY